MGSEEHTPWTYGRFCGREENYYIRDCNNALILGAGRKMGLDMAALIAAAPDLYEAASAALGYFDALIEEPHHPGEAKILDALQAAISKATPSQVGGEDE